MIKQGDNSVANSGDNAQLSSVASGRDVRQTAGETGGTTRKAVWIALLGAITAVALFAATDAGQALVRRLTGTVEAATKAKP